MKVKIGMLIWKEMKRQGITQNRLLELLRDKNIFIRDLFKMESIDTDALIQISEILKLNFFQYFEPEELNVFLKTHTDQSTKIATLKSLVQDQHRLLLTHKKIIKEQEEMLKTLKPGWLRNDAL